MLECLNDIFEKILHNSSQQHTKSKVLASNNMSNGVDFDAEISGSIGLNEIEETKSETNSANNKDKTARKTGGAHHRRTSSIPRQLKP
jgi:hypothetical protein